MPSSFLTVGPVRAPPSRDSLGKVVLCVGGRKCSNRRHAVSLLLEQAHNTYSCPKCELAGMTLSGSGSATRLKLIDELCRGRPQDGALGVHIGNHAEDVHRQCIILGENPDPDRLTAPIG